jgi:hypothetical protein
VKLKHMVLTTVMLIVPIALQASPKDSAKVTFDESVTIGGIQIRAGDYHVQWEGTGTSVEVTIIQAKKIVVRTAATLVEGNTPYDGAVDLKKEGNTTTVKAITWKNRSLYFDQADGSSGSAPASGANR